MRDDIHRSAPVTRKWRQFLKCCAREADRGRAIESAEKALVSECNRELPSRLIRALLKHCDSFFDPPLDSISSELEKTGPVPVLSQQLLEQLRIESGASLFTRKSLENTLDRVIRDRAKAQTRAMRGHILKEGRVTNDAARCIETIERAISKLSIKDYARQLVESQVVTVKEPARSLDLAEVDLLAPNDGQF